MKLLEDEQPEREKILEFQKIMERLIAQELHMKKEGEDQCRDLDLGNYEITLHSNLLPGDIDRYGFGWTDVYCFSIVNCRWHCSIGNITFIMDQKEKTNGI